MSLHPGFCLTCSFHSQTLSKYLIFVNLFIQFDDTQYGSFTPVLYYKLKALFQNLKIDFTSKYSTDMTLKMSEFVLRNEKKMHIKVLEASEVEKLKKLLYE